MAQVPCKDPDPDPAGGRVEEQQTPGRRAEKSVVFASERLLQTI